MHHGRGRFRVADGGVYEGEWRDGQESGHGVYRAGANEYEGQWAEGALKRGTWRREGKLYFEGEFVSLEHGFRPHGLGTLYGADGKPVYTGGFVQGRRAGTGRELTEEGGVYTGEFAGDTRHGQGVLKGDQGDVYTGEWSLGLRSGRGEIVFGNGNGSFEGFWDTDRPEGHGKRIWPKASVCITPPPPLASARG